jgi:hypothetical protein
MASGITHILLVKYLQNMLPEGRMKTCFAAGRDFLQAGAVGPDLPYASIADNDFFFSTQSDLADKLHYVRTNEVPLRALKQLHERGGQLSRQEIRYIFCFFAGYVSHVVADGIIHPFIRDKVGDYRNHQTEHRVLEMELDVLLFHHLTEKSNAPIELNYSNVHDELANLNEGTYPELRKAIDLFRDTIQSVYGELHETDLILGWIVGLHRMFSVAEGKHPSIYRIVGFVDNILFKDYEDLRKRYEDLLVLTTPVDRPVNFLKKPKIHYFDDIIPQFYEKFIPIAQKAYRYVYEDGIVLTEADIPAIDLDTGRPIASNNNLDLVPTFWS